MLKGYTLVDASTHKVVFEFHAETVKIVHAVYRKGRVNLETERTANFQVGRCVPTLYTSVSSNSKAAQYLWHSKWHLLHMGPAAVEHFVIRQSPYLLMPCVLLASHLVRPF